MNQYGNRFRISIFGESHGTCVGVTIDGVPAGIALSEDDLRSDLSRRAPGAEGTTARRESDRPEFVSGLYEGRTTGTPLTVLFRNEDTRPGDYTAFRDRPRPGHADFTASVKYRGFNDLRGGGHASGRLTLGLVAAGTVARKLLDGVRIEARLVAVGGLQEDRRERWPEVIAATQNEGDSLGGVIECRCTGVPAGWGEPFFGSVESEIARLAFSIPGVRGVEFGDGFAAALMRGSEHNDPIIDAAGHTARNGAGGVNGGLTNGNEIRFRVAVKPASSIAREQESFNLRSGRMERFSIGGRHDACIALRCPVIVEAVAAIALAELRE